jgi:glycosyltransferase involved in cell wall biosynthesis
MPETPTISIVTVTAFDVRRLEVTLISILKAATFAQFVVVCPKNDHETISFLRQFTNTHDIKLEIGHDNNSGIYQAMNIGARLATGDYLVYWNSGDFCANQANLIKLTEVLHRIKPAWGIFEGSFGWRTPQSLTEKNLRNFCLQSGGYISHQTVFMKRVIFLGLGGFDEKYKVAADSKIITQFWLNHTCFFFKSLIVAVDPPNFSASNHRIARFESLKTSIQVLTGWSRSIAIRNILAKEFNFFWKKYFNR